MLSSKQIKSDFPIFKNSDLIYLDNASTTQKPQEVLDATLSMYTECNANVHRAMYEIGSKATENLNKPDQKLHHLSVRHLIKK